MLQTIKETNLKQVPETECHLAVALVHGEVAGGGAARQHDSDQLVGVVPSLRVVVARQERVQHQPRVSLRHGDEQTVHACQHLL